MLDRLEDRLLLSADGSFPPAVDTNQDGLFQPYDALILLNSVSNDTSVDDAPQLDLNGDGQLSTADVDLIIGSLNSYYGGDWDAESIAALDDVTLAISDTVVSEGAAADVMVSLVQPTAEPVEVMVWSEGGTANAYEDFEATYVYLLFEPGGPTSQTVSVATMLDGVNEGDETFLMRASRTGGTTPAEAVATVTLHDVQLDLPSLSVIGSSVHEGGSATVTLTLDSVPATDLFITVWTADGTATGYEDYESLSTDYYWIAGDPLTQTFTIPTVADAVSEGDEAFTVYAGVRLTSATTSPVESSGSITILDGDSGDPTGDDPTGDDPTGDAQVPTITVSDVTVSEGDSATVAVTLSSPPSEPLSLYIGSESITATEGSDYDYVFDFLTFDPAGPLTQTVAVPTFGDNEAEDDETFRIVVTNSQTYELHSGVITISDPNEEESHSCSITDPLPQFTGGEEATTATALVNDSSGASLAVIEGQHIVFSAVPAPWDSVTLSGPGLMETTFRRGEPIVFHVDDDTPVGTPADTVEISVEWTHQCGHIAPTTTFFTVQNVAPTAGDDVEVTSEDDVVYLDRLLLNDTDPSDADSQILSFGEFDIEGVSGGTIRRDSAGRLLYDPGDAFNDLGAGEEATDTFQYRVQDDDGGVSEAATVTMVILGRAESYELSVQQLADGNEELQSPARFRVSLDRPAEAEVAIQYSVLELLESLANAKPSDLTNPIGTVIFEEGENIVELELVPKEDDIVELNETGAIVFEGIAPHYVVHSDPFGYKFRIFDNEWRWEPMPFEDTNLVQKTKNMVGPGTLAASEITGYHYVRAVGNEGDPLQGPNAIEQSSWVRLHGLGALADNQIAHGKLTRAFRLDPVSGFITREPGELGFGLDSRDGPSYSVHGVVRDSNLHVLQQSASRRVVQLDVTAALAVDPHLEVEFNAGPGGSINVFNAAYDHAFAVHTVELAAVKGAPN